jgi:hypothetical protein
MAELVQLGQHHPLERDAEDGSGDVALGGVDVEVGSQRAVRDAGAQSASILPAAPDNWARTPSRNAELVFTASNAETNIARVTAASSA